MKAAQLIEIIAYLEWKHPGIDFMWPVDLDKDIFTPNAQTVLGLDKHPKTGEQIGMSCVFLGDGTNVRVLKGFRNGVGKIPKVNTMLSGGEFA